MVQYTVNKKVMTGLVFLIGSTIGGLSGCGDDDCSGAKSGQLKNGAYLSKEYGLESNAQLSRYDANDDGCPPGCSSSSDTCCWCP